MSKRKPGNFDYSKPYESEADFRNRKLLEQEYAREARVALGESLEGERQKQGYVDMGLKLAANIALTGPLGLIPGTALGFGTEYAMDAVMNDPKLKEAVKNVTGLIKTRSGKQGVPQAEENVSRSLSQYEAYQKAFGTSAKEALAEAKAREEAFKNSAFYKGTVLHKPTYDLTKPTTSIDVGPITYIAPVANASARKKERMDVYLAQQKQMLEDAKKTNLGVLGKQRSELASLQNLQEGYYSALQYEMAKQQVARNAVARIEASQKAQAEAQAQAPTPTPVRKLPKTIDLYGRVVGGRRRK